MRYHGPRARVFFLEVVFRHGQRSVSPAAVLISFFLRTVRVSGRASSFGRSVSPAVLVLRLEVVSSVRFSGRLRLGVDRVISVATPSAGQIPWVQGS